MIKTTVEMRRVAVTLRHPLGLARWGSGMGAGEDAPVGGSLGCNVTRAGRPCGIVTP